MTTFENIFLKPGIHGGERVIQQVDVQVRVERPRQVHPLPLTAGQGHPSLTDQSQVTLTKDLDLHTSATLTRENRNLLVQREGQIIINN
jgi:hypothetical protein